jgi:hypothetical protein
MAGAKDDETADESAEDNDDSDSPESEEEALKKAEVLSRRRPKETRSAKLTVSLLCSQETEVEEAESESVPKEDEKQKSDEG